MHFLTANPLLMLIDIQQAIDDPSWGTRNNPNAFDKTDLSGLDHKAEVVHNMSLANLNGEYAEVVSTQDILGRLGNATT